MNRKNNFFLGSLSNPPRHLTGVDELFELEQPYLLCTFLPYYLDPEGNVWLDRLWHRDLTEHLIYLKNLKVAAPCYKKKIDQPDLVQVEHQADCQPEFLPLPRMESLVSAILRLPKACFVLWKAIGKVKIVHSGIVGWPFPIGWLANSIALLRGRKLFLVVESASWRIVDVEKAGWKKRLRARITECLGRFFVNRADLSIFTQPAYHQSLMTRGKGRGIVIPASWIHEKEIIDRNELQLLWERKNPLREDQCRFLFPARLTVEKGVRVLLKALQILTVEKVSCRIDIIGEGPLREECVREINKLKTFEASVLEPVNYGEPFFKCLREYHCVLVPSLSDEQPRIVFDAYSQGLAVLAANTDGLRPYVIEGETGWLVPANDSRALASKIREIIHAPSQLKECGIRAVDHAHLLTHQLMHRRRWKVLLEYFGCT